jgi:non-specific serine/threonine protein kinase
MARVAALTAKNDVPVDIGTKLGPYEIVARIGAGGMGEVYRAFDTKLKREVAIKVLPEVVVGDADHTTRFAREAELLASLNHPNLAAIHTIDEHAGRPFIVMELLTGPTLRSVIDGRPQPIERVLELASQIADGLAAAHAHGVIHRDIKPENIVIAEDGHVKLLDFGLAKLVPGAELATVAAAAPRLTQTGTVMGTVSYMSPEQARGELTDARTDLFSFGVVLYEIITGRLPFRGNTPAAIFDAILNRLPPPIQQLNPTAPQELRRIVDKLLEKDRQLRYQSAADLRSDLARLARETASGSLPKALDAENNKKSIVVVPFSDVSPAKDKEYFADGLSDEIIADLSQIQSIRVISRNSSRQLKTAAWDAKTIARELQVQYLLEGTVRSAGDNLRVTAQLVDAASGQNLWADKYSGKLEDVFDIQERISRQIVGELKMKLTPTEERRLGDRKITDVRAYDCYQRARQHIYDFSEGGLTRALRLIEDALAIVGDNELLYAAQGTVYWQYVNAGIRPDDRYLDMAEDCAKKVFRLDSESASGFQLLGLVQMARGHHADALRSLKHTLAIEPNNVQALGELGRIYLVSGKTRAARETFGRLLALDPLDLSTQYAVFGIEILEGNPELWRPLADRVLESAPYYAILRFPYAFWLVHTGQLDAARTLLARGHDDARQGIASGCCNFLRHALDGRIEEALACLSKDLQAAARRVEWWSFYVSWCYAFVDETEHAVDWLENASQRGFIHYPFLSRPDVPFARLRGNERFDELLERIKQAWEKFPT